MRETRYLRQEGFNSLCTVCELWDPPEGGGLGAAAALKQAPAFVRSHEEWRHPYYWAACVLWGLAG